MFDPIQVAISKAVTETSISIDDYLLSFFGSEENVREFGKYYVLEYKTPEFETLPEEGNMSFRIRMDSEYRLRLKTKEELENT
jgi:hypothetical protein